MLKLCLRLFMLLLFSAEIMQSYSQSVFSEAINSASCRALCTIMNILEELFLKGNNEEVEWKYNVEDNELKER
jgi:hypothetical protein